MTYVLSFSLGLDELSCMRNWPVVCRLDIREIHFEPVHFVSWVSKRLGKINLEFVFGAGHGADLNTKGLDVRITFNQGKVPWGVVSKETCFVIINKIKPLWHRSSEVGIEI